MKNLFHSASEVSEEAKFIYQETVGDNAEAGTAEKSAAENKEDAVSAEILDMDLDDIPKDPEARKAFVDKIGNDLNFAKDFFADNKKAYVDEQGFIHPGDGTTIKEGNINFEKFRKDCFLISGQYENTDYAKAMATILPKGADNMWRFADGKVLTGDHLRELKAYVDSGDEAKWTDKVADCIGAIMPGKEDVFRAAGSNFGTLNMQARMMLGNLVKDAKTGAVNKWSSVSVAGTAD